MTGGPWTAEPERDAQGGTRILAVAPRSVVDARVHRREGCRPGRAEGAADRAGRAAGAAVRRQARPAGRGACCSSCRAWTPRARAASSSTSSGSVNPQGVRSPSFKAPTRGGAGARLPLAHPQARCRGPGMIGVFDRSHYEDVLVARVHDLVPPTVDPAALRADRRVRAGTGRLRAPPSSRSCCTSAPASRRSGSPSGSTEPDKHWKYNPGDVDERPPGHAYQEAYQLALERTLDRRGAVVRRAGRPQVVRAPGRAAAAARRAARHAP